MFVSVTNTNNTHYDRSKANHPGFTISIVSLCDRIELFIETPHVYSIPRNSMDV